MTMDHDLLTEPLLSWRTVDGHRGRTTLPGLLEKLASGELADFPRLRTHQFHPWCMFLTQVAAIALHAAGRTDPAESEAAWKDMLLALTAGRHEPWSLVVDDLSLPAFLQPPVPEGTLAGWRAHEHPDDIDILVTSRAVDVKPGQIPADDIESWAYALVTLQTMQGVYGARKYGISRMYKGFGNRPRVGLASDLTPVSRFIRDLRVLLGSWENLLERGFTSDGLSLVWTAPWDGRSSLSREELSPHFIEVCRRVRCRSDRGALTCVETTSSGKRSLRSSMEELGDVGDPWIPIRRTGAALKVDDRGFHYRLMSDLVCHDEEFESPSAQRQAPGDRDQMLLLAWALVRGQGKTEGIRERELVLPGPVRWKLNRPDGRPRIARRSRQQVDDATRLRNKVLLPALKQLRAPGPAKLDDLIGLDRRIDESFFDQLFSGLESEDDAAAHGFIAHVRAIAWDELHQAIDDCGFEDAQRLKRTCAAERVFEACFRKQFSDIVSAASSEEA